MCVIIKLEPKQEFPKDKFFNCVWNNEHGFGMITRDKDGEIADVKRLFDKRGMNPEPLWDLVNKEKEYERIIHVRNSSAGGVVEQNVHPLPIVEDKKNNKFAYFLHNGTLHSFKRSVTEQAEQQIKHGEVVGNRLKGTTPAGVKFNIPITDLDEAKYSTGNNHILSDSYFFVEDVLKPAFESGIDFGSQFFIQTLYKFWSTNNNRGLIVSNFTDDITLSPSQWKDVDGALCSNDDYFDVLKRGTHFEALEKERKEREQKEEEERRKNSVNTRKDRLDDGYRAVTQNVGTPFEISDEVFVDLNGFIADGIIDEDDSGQVFERIDLLSTISNEEFRQVFKRDVDTSIGFVRTLIHLLTEKDDKIEQILESLNTKAFKLQKATEIIKEIKHKEKGNATKSSSPKGRGKGAAKDDSRATSTT